MTGRLIYLMGPSGSGKDSLLDAARERLAARGCVIARRVITRSAEAVGEDAIGVSPAEFDQQEAAGAFALSWRANGLAYGIPRQIDDWLAAGQDVLVNGSRGYLPQARERYPELLAILLQVDEAALRQRLQARGRESAEQIEARLARSRELQADAACSPLPRAGVRVTQDAQAEGPGERAEVDPQYLLNNSGPLDQTVSRLLLLLSDARACA
ncbi:phosphonate metabolism protein/1,5-bisphosphokinase (PRPP-forming) PhnN [Pseudomonas sp. Ga0074129]|uniref:phosphonate metabolism protein/1,5-bisphosphokinase (PRPP-forming) PhnN n=1 Tax=Pseudomonas sp. Ga0074129 TaxID=1752219 RepID=UPI000AA8B2E2|nr:phosphonate metabolism protein/1,5-bisphosphokinase (PRPP-forming) PhnN [Pseudomonas sp. Ga0074129]